MDLASEALGGPTAAQKVSRRAALLALGADGAWNLQVLGRAPLRVNGITLHQHQVLPPPRPAPKDWPLSAPKVQSRPA